MPRARRRRPASSTRHPRTSLGHVSPQRPGAGSGFDQLDAVAVRVADEAEPRAALGDGVRRALGLDARAGEPLEGPVEVVDRDRDVAIAGADLVRLGAAVVVGQLEAGAVAG